MINWLASAGSTVGALAAREEAKVVRQHMVEVFAAPAYANTGVEDGHGETNLAKFGGVLVVRTEMRRLAPGRWLSGDNIVAFTRAVASYAGARAAGTLVVDTLFVSGTMLEAGEYSFANGRRYRPDAMDAACRIVVPLHVPVAGGGTVRPAKGGGPRLRAGRGSPAKGRRARAACI